MNRLFTLLMLLGMLVAYPTNAQEIRVTPAPAQADMITGYAFRSITMMDNPPLVMVSLEARGQDGNCVQTQMGCKIVTVTYLDNDAIEILNLANTSIKRRIFNKLQRDGSIPRGDAPSTSPMPTLPEPTATEIPATSTPVGNQTPSS